jgi:hypothetical protein
MNDYAEKLKEKLNAVDTYVVHEQDFSHHTYDTAEVRQKSVVSYITFKNISWFVGILIISVSVIAFVTQATLLVIDNMTNVTENTNTEQDVVNKTIENIYVRSDLDRNPFDNGSSTELLTSKKIPPNQNLGIPGVSRIGYDEIYGEQFLTDNVNKYSDTTLVIGGREGELSQKEKGKKVIGGGDDLKDQDRYSVLPKAYIPILSSKAYLVADLETGEIILEKNKDTIYPLASVSKLMTALIAREKMNMQTVAIVSRDASKAYGAQGGLGLGEKIQLRDLLFPLLMESSNDAAEVYADQYGNAKFIEEMNKKARELDMLDTYYGDPSGLDPKNTSTPYDMLTLVQYIAEKDPEIFDITRVKQFSVKGHTWYNRNRLLPLAGFVGGKNGYIDQALQTTASIFEIPLAKGGVRKVVIVILKSQAKDTDVQKLLTFIKRSVVYQAE